MTRNSIRKLLVPALLAGTSASFGTVLMLQLSAASEAAPMVGTPDLSGAQPVAGPAGQPAASAKRGAKQPAAAHGLDLPPLAEYAAIADRPLFRSTRRRPDPPSAPEAEPATSFSSKLVGIMIGAESRVAWVRDNSGEVIPVRVGERMQGWFLRAIEKDKVVFEGERLEELKLFPETPLAPAVTGKPSVAGVAIAQRAPAAPMPHAAAQPTTTPGALTQVTAAHRATSQPYRPSSRRPEQR